MIDPKSSPLGWALLSQELIDARDHLGELIQRICSSSEYSEVEFQIELLHVYSHLNKAWRRRLIEEDFATDEEWEAASAYPDDLEILPWDKE